MSSPSESYVCEICTRRFKRNEHLIRHLRTHTKERPFGCPLCDKRFSRQDTLKRHVIRHTDESDSSNNRESSTLEQASWPRTNQILMPELSSVDLQNMEAEGLDWFDELTIATQRLSRKSPLDIPPSWDLPNELTSSNLNSPKSRRDSATIDRSKALYTMHSRGGNPHYCDRGLPEGGSLNLSMDTKLPPELFNTMVDDYARKWLRDLCQS